METRTMCFDHRLQANIHGQGVERNWVSDVGWGSEKAPKAHGIQNCKQSAMTGVSSTFSNFSFLSLH